MRLIPAVLTGLLLPVLSQAAFHFQKNAQTEVSSEEAALAKEISDFLDAYALAYNDQDYRTVKSMWLDDGNPIYMAEEVPFPLYGQDKLENYFNPVPGRQILAGIDNRYSEVRAKLVAPDIAVATYRLDYDIKLVNMPAQHGWNRIMAVFARTDDGWKLTAYTEAPMGPATMVRKMMKAVPPKTEQDEADYATTRETIRELAEAGVSPGFDEFLDARKDIEPKH
jgi:ketosteroid isomerase-like protein